MQYITEELEGILALIYNDECVGLQLPTAVELTITECDPAIRGNSAGSLQQKGLTDELAGTAKPTKTTEPPPAVKKHVPQVPQSLGVINGRAIDLPTPPYPPQALAVGLQGNVSVQVLIDEQGRVVTAKAVGGPKLLQASAVNAAKRARFIPTKLSLKPVKATGIIVYKFKRN